MIPKMCYFIRRTQNNKKVTMECIQSVEKQSNFDGYFFIDLDWGVAASDWYVIVNDDVQLKDEWIEDIWKYRNDGDTIAGRAFTHSAIVEYKQKTMTPKLVPFSERISQCILTKEINWLRSVTDFCANSTGITIEPEFSASHGSHTPFEPARIVQTRRDTPADAGPSSAAPPSHSEGASVHPGLRHRIT